MDPNIAAGLDSQPSPGGCQSLAMIWEPLEQEREEIRLLTLYSGAFENDIKCTIRTVSLGQHLEYAALSYCWGIEDDPNNRGTISINGQSISVTKSLATALKYMRRDNEEVIVWNDATCINQKDEIEQESQIRLMGQIYAKALQVWIWLGESADGSDCAMDLINNVTTMKSSDPSYQPDRDAWRATNFLFKRPWFTRLWVLQETLFARRATVHCGEKAVDLKMFLHFNDMESMYRRQNDSRLQPILSPMNIIFSDWKRVKSSLTKGKLTLFELISMTGEFKCKKEKDKIFALLSLCTAEERRYFSFDYNLDVPLLMIKVARYFISTRQLQSPMKILQTHQDGKKLSLPSWVPDYTTPDVESHLMIPATKGNTPYKAGADNDAWAGLGLPRLAPEIIRSKCEDAFGPALGRIIGIFLGNVSWTVTRRMNSARVGGGHLDKVLVLSGLKFDIIKFASKMPRVDYYEGTDEKEDRERKRQRRETTIDTCKQWDRHVQTIPSETGPYATPHGRREAYWRSLIADRDFDLKAPPNPSHDFAGRFEAWIGNDEGRAEYARPYSDAAVWRCINRSFVITEKGYLGLAPSGARKGDVISVLRGGYVPFVLRKGDHSDWKLVGEAYVHGIMDGSWVREAAKEDVMEFRMT